MKGSIKKYMKVGILHFMSFPECIKGDGPILETLQKIAVDEFFDAVEMTWINDDDTRAKAAQMIDVAGMSVAFGAQPMHLTTGQNINDLDESKRIIALNALKRGVDEAYELKAKGFSYLSGKYADETFDESYAQLTKSTKELLDYAKAKGDMPIALEVFDYDIDKKSIIGPTALAKKFAQEITSEYDNFGLLVDLSHTPLCHETIEGALVPLKDYIIHTHIGTCVMGDKSIPAYGDLHPRFNFANSENSPADLAKFITTLDDIGYFQKFDRPFLSFEVRPTGDEDSELVIANCKRVLNEAWAMIAD
ncbi:MAG: TIM barrel protein [Clostridia bacterium]|jgi:sugar phosphate isomerase/epimerase|nr:TIM barrel protein [Clostridia bacterium]MBT7122473.1 TIM barrel protein [Clostridia bacterium]